MKKHELLKYAYDNYPKGTIFKNLFTGKEETSTGVFACTPMSICDDNTHTMIMQHSHGKWAEIVPEKPSEVILFPGSEEVKVNLEGFSLTNNPDVFFTDQELIRIYQAYQSLLPF